MLKKTGLFIAILFLFSHLGFARPMNEFPPSPWTEKEGYFSQTFGKLGFGLMNLAGGWTGIVSEFHEQPEDNPAMATMRAVARVVTNTVGGALHVVTFPAPFDIPLPGGGTSFE